MPLLSRLVFLLCQKCESHSSLLFHTAGGVLLSCCCCCTLFLTRCLNAVVAFKVLLSASAMLSWWQLAVGCDRQGLGEYMLPLLRRGLHRNSGVGLVLHAMNKQRVPTKPSAWCSTAVGCSQCCRVMYGFECGQGFHAVTALSSIPAQQCMCCSRNALGQHCCGMCRVLSAGCRRFCSVAVVSCESLHRASAGKPRSPTELLYHSSESA